VHEALEARRAEREQLIELARGYVRRLSRRLPVASAVVAGSVARGDFNVWSDVDVVVVAEGLPARSPDRTALLAEDAPPRVQPVGFTPGELEHARRRGNRLVADADAHGIDLLGRPG
jgi:predicted nucleotidyltransferase